MELLLLLSIRRRPVRSDRRRDRVDRELSLGCRLIMRPSPAMDRRLDPLRCMDRLLPPKPTLTPLRRLPLLRKDASLVPRSPVVLLLPDERLLRDATLSSSRSLAPRLAFREPERSGP